MRFVFSKDRTRKVCTRCRQDLSADVLRARHNGATQYLNSTCRECDAAHIVPISKGGAHSANNVVPACGTCNSSKGDRSLLSWLMAGGMRRVA